MNREQILAMGPGRELDALVAEQVMGWKSRIDFDVIEDMDSGVARYEPFSMNVSTFSPSTDISAAWEVLNKMRDENPVRFETALYDLMNPNREAFQISPLKIIWHMNPLTICQAALLATLDPRGGDTDG